MTTYLPVRKRNINDYYSDIANAVVTRTVFSYFKVQYNMVTNLPPVLENKNYAKWIDYLLDSYNKYKHAGFNDTESQINAVMDGLEALLK